MSQRNVENLIGRLVTDEGFRRRFTVDPGAALVEATEGGFELTFTEVRALLSIDTYLAERLAQVIDPRILKIDLPQARA